MIIWLLEALRVYFDLLSAFSAQGGSTALCWCWLRGQKDFPGLECVGLGGLGEMLVRGWGRSEGPLFPVTPHLFHPLYPCVWVAKRLSLTPTGTKGLPRWDHLYSCIPLAGSAFLDIFPLTRQPWDHKEHEAFLGCLLLVWLLHPFSLPWCCLSGSQTGHSCIWRRNGLAGVLLLPGQGWKTASRGGLLFVIGHKSPHALLFLWSSVPGQLVFLVSHFSSVFW